MREKPVTIAGGPSDAGGHWEAVTDHKRMVSTMVCGPFGGIYPYPFSGRANQKLRFFPARQRPPGKTARPLPRVATPHRARCSMREMAPPFSDNRPSIIALPTRGRAHTFWPRRCSYAPCFPRREGPAACGQTVDLIRQGGG